MKVSRRDTLLGLSGLAAGARGDSLVFAEAPAPSTQGSDYADLQRRYDAIAAAGGGTLRLPAGVHNVTLVMHSRVVHLCGAGRNATILVPRNPDLPVFQQRYATAGWDAVTISDLTIKGSGKGTALDYGDTAADRFTGRTILRNVRFTGFSICVRRSSGNIGLYLEGCQFDAADYHIWGQSFRGADGLIMHDGVLSARDCHFQEAAKAVLYVDSSVPGSGQITFDTCTFESNPGFVFVFARFESRDGVPGISVRSCWNENNATGGSSHGIQLAGKYRSPAFLFADRVGLIEFSDTPPGAMVLLGDTSVVTRSCALDMLDVVEASPAATLTHYDARIFGDRVVPGLTRSLTNANQKNFGPTGAIFRLPHRIGIVRPRIDGAHAVGTCAAPMNVEGKRRVLSRSVPDAILPGLAASQQLDLVAGDAGYVATIAVPAPAYLAWTFSYRRISGAPVEFVIAGRAGISTQTTLDADAWTTIGGVAFIDRPLDQIGFLIRSAGPASIRIGGYQLICFPSRMAATEMLNDGLFRDQPV
ncbi:hypothetical protein ACM61V_03800 [Sphingomonas sp. TX0543]|uniref:hypothetical protein n=1 Tax=unclassified Sphingomonas TaxID=196159 RepID=UPI0010F4CF24|nr:hypothetical protein [Sphingomonas sp. 3P27F8]